MSVSVLFFLCLIPPYAGALSVLAGAFRAVPFLIPAGLAAQIGALLGFEGAFSRSAKGPARLCLRRRFYLYAAPAVLLTLAGLLAAPR